MQLKENELQQDVEAVRATFDHIGALRNQCYTKKAIIKSALGDRQSVLDLPCAKYFH
jgi:hypothetical protein